MRGLSGQVKGFRAVRYGLLISSRSGVASCGSKCTGLR